MLQVLMFLSTQFMGAIFAFTRAPVFAFAMYQAVYFIYPQNRWWGYMVPDLPYSFITVICMFCMVVVHYKKVKSNVIYKVPIFKWQLFLLIIVWFVYTQAIAPWHHTALMDSYSKLFIIMILAFMLINERKHLDYAIWGYLYGAWFSSFIVYQVGRNAGDRVEGIGTVDAPESNGLAAALAPSVVLCLYYFWVSRTYKEKVFFAIAGAFTANAIVLINSRASFLAVAVSVTFLMWKLFFSKFQRKNQKVSIVWVGVLGMCAALYLVDDGFISRMQTISSEQKTDEQESGKTRISFWLAAVDVSKDYPLGLGARGFDHVSHIYVSEDVDTGKSRNRSVHSTWFEVLTESGYLGLFCFIGMLLSCTLCLKKVRKKLVEENDIDAYFKMYAIQAALICFMISMTFMNRFRAEILGWLILFIASAYNLYVLRPETKVDNTQTQKTPELKGSK
jgi:hypothetical protein